MSKLVLPKATTAAREAATPVAGEIFYDTEKLTLFYGDGATAGGVPLKIQTLANTYVYGIDHDTSIATAASACRRVVLNQDHDTAGDPQRYSEVNSFAQMPAHNFKRCVVSDLASRTVSYYLNPSDSRKKENGQPAVLTGADGDVAVELPVCHYRQDSYTDASAHVHRVYLVSNRAFTGSAPHRFFYTSEGGATLRAQYVGAFRSVLCDSTGAVKAQSSDGTPATYVAGDKFRSIAGVRPHGGARRSDYRSGSVAHGGTTANAFFGQYLALMMAIDGCTFDTQAGISEGFSYLSAWNYAALRATGRTACYGNGTGDVVAEDSSPTGADYDLLSMATGGGTLWDTAAQANPALKVVQFSYRGIEDPYGAQWCFEDGVQKYQTATADDYAQSGYWITNDTSAYALLDTDRGAGQPNAVFPAVGYTGATYAWVSNAWPKAAGYVGGFDATSFLPTAVGGASTTYLGDYFFGDAEVGARVLLRGGVTHRGGCNGVGCLCAHAGLAYGDDFYGSRLAC